MSHVEQQSLNTQMIKTGYTGIALAKRVGISQSYMSQIASGRKSPSPPLAKNICKALECEFDDIFLIRQEA